MKKVLVLGTVLSSLLFLGSCKSDDKAVAPVVTQQLYPTPTVKMGLNIHVLASSEAGRSAGLDGATVTVKQNGASYTSGTDESGIATFSGLGEGSVRYYIKKAGFASINGETTLYYDGTPVVNGDNGTSGDGSVTVNNEQQFTESISVSLPKTGASVSGVVMGDLDFGGSAVATPLGAGAVVLKLPNNYEPNIYTANLTGTNGVYTFTDLPEGVNYTLYSQGIVGTVAATSSTPSHQLNLSFPGGQNTGTTPNDAQVQHRGVTVLQ